MRLLVPTRICLALRWATTPAASRAPKRGNKAAAATKLKENTAPQDAPSATPTPKLSNREAAALRETTQQRDALAYLDAGKNEEFRAQWKGKLLGGALSDNVTLHDALLKSAQSGTPDPAMLRWFTESLVDGGRTPFQAKPQFESMLVPVVRAFGGKIEKWEEDDKRKEKLRKWRDDYKDEALENLLGSMLDYLRTRTDKNNEPMFPAGNVLVLERALERVKRQDKTVAVNWSDIVYNEAMKNLKFDSLLPHHTLVQVGREAESKLLQFSDFDLLHLCDKNDRLMEKPSEVKITRKLDGFCTLMLAVASRGHWLSNGAVKYDTTFNFGKHLKHEKKDDKTQEKLLKNFANDSVLRYTNSGVVQPAVDHSRAPQFIDQDKKELAFTVARDIEELPPKHPYKSIEYYSIHLD